VKNHYSVHKISTPFHISLLLWTVDRLQIFAKTTIMEEPVSIVTLAVFLSALRPSYSSTSEIMASSKFYSTVPVGNGNTYCAIDENTASIERATSLLRCGQLCALQPFCYHFNYFAKKKRCEMFYTPPQRFGVVDGCRSYVQAQVRRLET